MERLVSLLLLAREVAHRAHWRTGSYAEHVALGEFYDALPDFADELVECYQGCEGEKIKVPFAEAPKAVPDMVTFLDGQLKEIRKARTEFDEYPEFQNQIDTIVSHYQRTLYKLRFLD